MNQEQIASDIKALAGAIHRQAAAIEALVRAFATLAGEEFGTPAKQGEAEPSPHSTMDGGELKFRGARGG